MGSLFHDFDIDKDIVMAGKVAHKSHFSGLDAPRNSLEQQMETSYGLYSARDNTLYAHQMAYEIPEKSSNKNNPSVVARLMGVDMLPFDSANIQSENPTFMLTDDKPLKRDLSASNRHVELNRPKPREHPQEEELQKFKKEFEAFQSARFQECSQLTKVDSAKTQLIAQENLNREKMQLYTNSKRTTKTIDHAEMTDSCKKENSYPYSKIMVLRSGMDIISEDSWNTTTTPSTSEEKGEKVGGGIEEFLHEVKERLKSELQGTCPKGRTSIRGGGIETPFWEKPSEEQIAQEVRDSVSRDLLEMNLLRSESTRSYRSDSQLNGRDARRLLAERLSNVLRKETKRIHEDYGWQLGEKQSRSFRMEIDEVGLHQNDVLLSPSNLIRSFSAPISGPSFGKLLLEDRQAQIRRKHEAIEKVPLNIKTPKKDKFNIREKVSSFRYNWTFRGRLFRRRVKSVDESDQSRSKVLRDIRSGPSVMTSFYETHENSTEVPPSPASVCSSVQEEFWRQAEYLSPISSSCGHHLEDGEMPHAFREINSNLNELRRKLDRFEGAVPEETLKEEHLTEVEADIEDQTEAYVRDLLIAAGLYDGSYNQLLSKWDPLGKPISTQAFEEVEGTDNGKDQGEKVNRRILFDLLNEVLPALLREPVNMYGRKLLSRVWNIISVHVPATEDRSCRALDKVLAGDLMSAVWAIDRFVDDDANGVGRDIECQIIGDMICEAVSDMYSL